MFKKFNRVVVVRILGDIADFEGGGFDCEQIIGMTGEVESVDDAKICSEFPINVKLDGIDQIYGFSENELELVE